MCCHSNQNVAAMPGGRLGAIGGVLSNNTFWIGAGEVAGGGNKSDR